MSSSALRLDDRAVRLQLACVMSSYLPHHPMQRYHNLGCSGAARLECLTTQSA